MPLTLKEFGELYPNVKDSVLAARFDVSKDVIYRTGKALKQEGLVEAKKKGRPNLVSAEKDVELQEIVENVKKDLEYVVKRDKPKNGRHARIFSLGKLLPEDIDEIIQDGFIEEVIRAIVKAELQAKE